jgi:hypothetical protein
MLGGRAAGGDGVPAYERIGRFIFGFHRIVSRDELDRKSLAARHAPAELLSRAGRLADEFDRIVQNGGAVADVQMDVTLREAAEVQKALAAWRQGLDH